MSKFQSRWVAFAKSQGKRPEEVLGQNAEYLGWVARMVSEWCKVEGNGKSRYELSKEDHVEIDAWLDAKFSGMTTNNAVCEPGA